MAAQTGTVKVFITEAWITTSADIAVEGELFTYTGSPVTPAVSVTLKNTRLIEDRDYTLVYTNHTNVGTATVTVTGKGNYTGTATRTFVISKAKAPEISWPTGKRNYLRGKGVGQPLERRQYPIRYIRLVG